MAGRSDIKKGWGGARDGAGRPKETLSVQQVREMLLKAKEYAEKHGKTVHEILLDFIYPEEDSGITKRDQLAALKLWLDKTHIELKEGGEGDTQLGPGLFIPEQDKDPVLKVVGE